MGLLMRKYFSACIFLLQYRPQRPRIVARLRIDAEVPARLVDLRGGEDFHQCLPGSTSTLAEMVSSSWVILPVRLMWTAPMMRTVFRSSAWTRAKPDDGECAPCLRLATSFAPPVSTVSAWERTVSASSLEARARKMA